MRELFVLILVGIFFSCQQTKENAEIKTSFSIRKERPNILWLVAEDLGPYIPSFGDSTISTPNLSWLASEGVRYTNVYSTSGVCAPSRAAIATGMYPTSIGANNMRTGSYAEVTGLPKYEAVPPPEVRMFSEILRSAGYYCSNNSKGDYQFQPPGTAWDESSQKAHWRNRNSEQPFFSIFNFVETHESGLFEPYERSILIPKETSFSIPPYLPDNEIVRRDVWKMYNNIALMDQRVGKILDQLKEDGLLDKTIIFFYTDHGGPLPRQKRLIYDAGLKVPLIIRFPDRWNAGKTDDQLISFIDLAPTILTLAGQAPPDYLQGQTFVGNEDITNRKYIHAAADRFDGFTDVIRAVRDKRFKYVRNYRPDQGYYLPVTYRERIPTMQELLRFRDNGQLNATQALWFRNNKPKEELYDCVNDPHEIENLAHDPDYADKLLELSSEMDRWLAEIGDQPNLPERELIDELWQSSDNQPITSEPVVTTKSNGKVSIACETEGASIGYRIINDSTDYSAPWKIYKEPLTIDYKKIEIQAHRIGYKPSNRLLYQASQAKPLSE